MSIGSGPAAEHKARQSLVDVCLAANASGINQGTSGNASVRWGDGLLVTSAVPYEDTTLDDIVYVAADGTPTGRRQPSTEWHFHHDILATRDDVDAVLHLHSPAATALSTLRRSIPAFHYMVAIAGGNSIRCGDYATFGTPELSTIAVEALRDRTACLLSNHGQITVAATPAKALALAAEVEFLADQYLRALAVEPPVLLSEEEMAEVLLKFEDYKRAGAPLPDDDR
ncbi:MAG: class II aldolase/adducin family protein [Acidimicrobiales bacterium]